jgi:hypothetical protein
LFSLKPADINAFALQQSSLHLLLRGLLSAQQVQMQVQLSRKCSCVALGQFMQPTESTGSACDRRQELAGTC